MALTFEIVGALVLAFLAATLLIGTFGWAVDTCKNLYTHLCYKAEELARRDVGRRLMQESHWYHEDEAVMSALEIIGRKLCQGGYYDVADCRNEWRNRKGKSR